MNLVFKYFCANWYNPLLEISLVRYMKTGNNAKSSIELHHLLHLGLAHIILTLNCPQLVQYIDSLLETKQPSIFKFILFDIFQNPATKIFYLCNSREWLLNWFYSWSRYLQFALALFMEVKVVLAPIMKRQQKHTLHKCLIKSKVQINRFAYSQRAQVLFER